MTITLIAAVSQNGVIGKENTLPWRLSDDLKFFKERTSGHSIIMGRKNYESIGRPLPNRKNIIISRQTDLKIDGCTVVSNIEDAINESTNTPFIIGGGEIYKIALPYASTFYKTNVHCTIDGDVFFPEYNSEEWQSTVVFSKTKDEKNEYDFDIEVLHRIHYDSSLII